MAGGVRFEGRRRRALCWGSRTGPQRTEVRLGGGPGASWQPRAPVASTAARARPPAAPWRGAARGARSARPLQNLPNHIKLLPRPHSLTSMPLEARAASVASYHSGTLSTPALVRMPGMRMPATAVIAVRPCTSSDCTYQRSASGSLPWGLVAGGGGRGRVRSGPCAGRPGGRATLGARATILHPCAALVGVEWAPGPGRAGIQHVPCCLNRGVAGRPIMPACSPTRSVCRAAGRLLRAAT